MRARNQYPNRRRLAAVLAALLAVPLAGRAEPPEWVFPEIPLTGTINRDDLKRTLECRQALLDDGELAALNIGVSSRAGVVTLWGLVPMRALAYRAADVVRSVPGVLTIRNEIHVAVPGDTLAELLPKADRHPPDLFLRPAAKLVSRTEEVEGGPLMPSIAISARVGNAPPVTLMHPVSMERPSLAEEVANLCRGQARFRHIQPVVSDGVVRLGGGVYRWEDLHELAREVSVLAGVERVILENVRAIDGGGSSRGLRIP